MKTILIRHAESTAVADPSIWDIPSNSAVGLSTTGVHQCVKLASTLDNLFSKINPDPKDCCVLSSTMLRTEQTYQLCRDLVKTTHRNLFKNRYSLSCLNELLDWRFPEESTNVPNEFLSWYNNCSTNSNFRSWDSMVASTGLGFFLGRKGTDNRLQMIFSHHYPINALLTNNLTKVMSPTKSVSPQKLVAIQNLNIPNAVPILLGFDTNVDYPGCIHGEHLIENASVSSVST